MLAVPLVLVLLVCQRHHLHADRTGLLYAALSGCVTSALGYVLWYRVRARMAAIIEGTVQLSVPVLSAALGMLLLGESLTARRALAALVVLLGVVLTTRATARHQVESTSQ
jgi:drug/metabolite transporter (DMT)-like permease